VFPVQFLKFDQIIFFYQVLVLTSEPLLFHLFVLEKQTIFLNKTRFQFENIKNIPPLGLTTIARCDIKNII